MLDKLVATQKENNARLAGIEKSVNALLAVNKKEAARQKIEDKRSANLERRTRGRGNKAPSAALTKKEAKEKAKGPLGAIFDMLKGNMGKLALGAAIVAALSNPEVQKSLGRLIEKLTPIFMKIAKKMADIIGGVLTEILKGGLKGIGDFFKGTPGKTKAFETAAAQMTDPAAIKKAEEYNKALEKKNKLELEYYKTAAAIVGLEDLKAKGKNVDGELKTEQETLKKKRETLLLQLKEMEQYKKFAQDKEFYEEENFRRRKAHEMYFRQGETGQTTGFLGLPGMRSFEVDKTKLGRFKSGGPIRVPGTGSGDKMFTYVKPGSFVMNRNATNAMGFQTGGVPVMLEPGEQVYGPGSWGPAEMMMNSIIPRFQQGGAVKSYPESQVGSARGGSIPNKDQPAGAPSGKTSGDKAIIEAAEASKGMLRGVSEMCARTTRNVLAAAGHPAANKTTGTGNLDPEGLAYNGPDFAASFAGSDMGTVKTSLSSAKAGDILLWKDTYGSFAPGAITHVGIAGEGNTQYDHGSASGWRKRSRNSLAGNFAYAIDLDGQATGKPSGSRARDAAGPAGGLVDNPVTNAIGGGLNALGGAAGEGLRAAGLPGLADYGEMFSRGFKESKAYTALPSMLGGLMNFGASFMNALTGGLFGSPAQASQTGGGQNVSGGPGQGGGSALGNLMGMGSPYDPYASEKPGGSGGATSGVGSIGGGASKLLSFIAKGEGGYNSMNQGTRNGRIVGSSHNASNILGKNITDMTLNEVMALQSSGKLFAAGRYQIIPGTMRNYAFPDSGLSGDDKFTPANQDKMGMALIKHKRPYAYKYLTGQHNDLRGAMLSMAKEWASLPDPATGNSVYGNGNRALHSVAEVEAAMKAARQGGGFQTGGIVNMKGSATNNQRRYEQAMDEFKTSLAQSGTPIIVPVPMGGGGGGNASVIGQGATPPPPDLPQGPQVVALLELQNRLALGAAL